MIIDFLTQDDDLLTLHKEYTAGRGENKRTIRCIKVIPITANKIDGMKISTSTVESVVDEDGNMVRLIFHGKYILYDLFLTFYEVPTIASILEGKKKVIQRNADSPILCRVEV